MVYQQKIPFPSFASAHIGKLAMNWSSKEHLEGTSAWYLVHWSVLGGREINWAPQLCVYDVADAVEIEDDFGRRRLRMREEAEVVYRDWISAFLIPPWWIDKTDRVGKMGWMHVIYMICLGVVLLEVCAAFGLWTLIFIEWIVGHKYWSPSRG